MSTEITVAIVEDNRQTREELAILIGGSPGYRVGGRFASMEEALAKLAWETADVILLDINLPGMSGIEGVERLKERHPATQILMLTVYADNEHVFEAICAGACGYLLKDTPPIKLLEAITDVHKGGAPMSPEIARKVVTTFQKIVPPKRSDYQLSPRELDVLKLLADGHSYKTAAHDLSLSTETIRFHIRHIYEKLHVHSKSEAVVKAMRKGLLQ